MVKSNELPVKAAAVVVFVVVISWLMRFWLASELMDNDGGPNGGGNDGNVGSNPFKQLKIVR